MSDRSSPTAGAAQSVRAFLGGLAVAGVAFFVFHRFDSAFAGSGLVPALVLAILLLGWALGAALGVRRQPTCD